VKKQKEWGSNKRLLGGVCDEGDAMDLFEQNKKKDLVGVFLGTQEKEQTIEQQTVSGPETCKKR